MTRGESLMLRVMLLCESGGPDQTAAAAFFSDRS